MWTLNASVRPIGRCGAGSRKQLADPPARMQFTLDTAVRERPAFWRGNVAAVHRELVNAAAPAGPPAPSLRTLQDLVTTVGGLRPHRRAAGGRHCGHHPRCARPAAQPEASVTAIAKLLGVSPCTLYNHIPDRRELRAVGEGGARAARVAVLPPGSRRGLPTVDQYDVPSAYRRFPMTRPASVDVTVLAAQLAGRPLRREVWARAGGGGVAPAALTAATSTGVGAARPRAGGTVARLAPGVR